MTDGLTVRDLVNRFLTPKQALVDSGEILRTSSAEYHQIFERIAEAFGLWRAVEDLRAEDFERLRGNMAAKWGPVHWSIGLSPGRAAGGCEASGQSRCVRTSRGRLRNSRPGVRIGPDLADWNRLK